MTSLNAENIEIRYDASRLPALKELTLTVRPGEVLGIIGPNGSGKSTLVRALSRTLRPLSGRILLEEKDMYTATSARHAAQIIGTVPQSTNIAFDFTVRDIVRMGRAPHLPQRPFSSETVHDEAIVDQSLRRAGVSELADKIITELSGGEQQRVLLARALAQEPDIILLDEPTAHLDLRHQREVLTLVQKLAHENGKAILAVLHDLNLAAEFCDRIILLNYGEIAAQGTPREVLTSETMQATYGVSVWVRRHPISGRPVLVPLADMPITDATKPIVHLLCGAGTGAGLMTALKEHGFPVTAGALNLGDTDQEAAEALQISYTKCAPFTALSDDLLVTKANYVVLTEMPFGPGNLHNLQLALDARRQELPVFCLQSNITSFSERDFTKGAATDLWNTLCASGATVMPNQASILKALTLTQPPQV